MRWDIVPALTDFRLRNKLFSPAAATFPFNLCDFCPHTLNFALSFRAWIITFLWTLLPINRTKNDFVDRRRGPIIGDSIGVSYEPPDRCSIPLALIPFRLCRRPGHDRT